MTTIFAENFLFSSFSKYVSGWDTEERLSFANACENDGDKMTVENDIYRSFKSSDLLNVNKHKSPLLMLITRL